LLTFTRAATAELAKKVSDHPAAATQRPSTIHSFSISVLLQNPGAGNFPEPLRIADDWEDSEIVHPTLARRANIHVNRLGNLIREMAANWESLQPALHPRVDPAERARFLGAWNEHRQIYGYVLLSELPYALRHALSNHPDLEGLNYEMLIVDEYQDLNACDLDVLRLIAERGCFIIGAPSRMPPTLVVFDSETSQLNWPGPRRRPRPALPQMVPAFAGLVPPMVGIAPKAALLK
jgi:DNA helicase-2/ATP-dependent DNA helicase PcrA